MQRKYGPNRKLLMENCFPPMEVPFSIEEYQRRLDQIRKRMVQNRIDMLYLSAPESMFYVNGYQAEWYQAQSPKSWMGISGIAVHADYDKSIHFDYEAELIMIRYATVSRDTRIFPLSERRGSFAWIINQLISEGWIKDGTVVGLEFWSYRPNRAISVMFEEALRNAGCKVVDGSDILREVRAIKSPTELAYIEKAAKIADIGISAVRSTLRPGVTELEVYGAIISAMSKAGGENPAITLPVLSGLKANCSHALASRKVITHGDIVKVDICGVYNRYHSNVARQFSIGEPQKNVAQFHAKVAQALRVAGKIVLPNLPVKELNSAMQVYYKDAGIWEDRIWVGGYELGIAFPPDWVGNFFYEFENLSTKDVFSPGTVVNFESVFTMPHMAGHAAVIDTIAFRQDSAQFLSKQPYDLFVIE